MPTSLSATLSLPVAASPTVTMPATATTLAPIPKPASKPTPTTGPTPKPTPTAVPAPTPTAAPAPTPAARTAAPPLSTETPSTTSRPTTTAPLRPADNSACTKAQRGTERIRADGSIVVCTATGTATGKAGRWTVQVPTTTTAAIAPTAPIPTVGFDGTTIRLGLLTTTKHPVWGTIGKVISAGIEAHVAAINRRGGIAGHYPIELVRAETNYDPNETVAQLNATKGSVVGFISILGTPNVEAVEPLLRQEQLTASPASQEARWALSPNLIPIGNSYQVQAINGIAYFLDSVANPKATVCGVSVATSYGDAGTEGIRFARDRLGFTAGPIVQIGAAETQLASAVGQLKGAGCQAVFLTVGPAQTLATVLTGKALGFAPRWIIMGASFSDRLVQPATGVAFEQGAWVVGDGTQWDDVSAEGIRRITSELIDSDNRFWTENPDVGLTYGWMQARAFEAILEKAVANNDLTRAGVLNAARQTGPVDTLGLGSPIDYSQPVRLAKAQTTIFAIDGSYRNAIRVLTKDFSSPAAQAYRK